jgi:hypothetical protein
VSHQPDERYWTDYLRIALPVFALLLMLGLFWYWAAALIGEPSADEPTAIAQVPTDDTVVEAPTPTPTATAVVTPVAPTPGPPPTATASVTNPTVQPTPTPPPQTDAAACAVAAEFATGTTVVTTDAVNLRQAPTTGSAIVVELPPGTQVQVTGAAEASSDTTTACRWWPVTNPATSQSGFVREDFVQAAS